MDSVDTTISKLRSVLSAGPKGLGTKTANIAAILNRPEVESDTKLRCRQAYRDDVALGEELNERLLNWAESIGLYEGHLDYLRKCNFGRLTMLTFAFSNDIDRLFFAGQANVSLFGVDDYFVDDERAGVKHDMVGRNLSLCMSVIDDPFLTPKYNADTRAGLTHPVHVAVRDYMESGMRIGTPSQIARIRHENMCLFLGMCHESSWRMNEMIAPVWEYLGCRQMNGLTTCIANIDIVEGYEVPHNIYSMPKVRQIVKLAGLITVLINDLVSSKKEEEAGVDQYGIREAIQKEEGCTFDEAHRKGVRLHNEMLRIFEDQSAELMIYATPELRRFLLGIEAWIAGNHLWHTTSERYTGA